MSIQMMVSQIAARLSQLGVPFQTGAGADLVIFNEFVDAGWSTGVKKISYEASVFFDEAAQVAYMWEKTVDTGGGISGGFSGGSTFQSGTTLFRKVKSIQYGPDGKAYEYSLDLGVIPKAVKEAASQSGWKFKTVLSKAKAQYPAGYQPLRNMVAAAATMAAPAAAAVPAAASAPAAAAAYSAAPAAASFCGNCGKPLTPESRFCPNCGQVREAGVPQPAQQFNAQPQHQPHYQPQPQYQHPFQPTPGRSIFRTLALISYIGLAVATIGLFALMKTSSTGWLIALPVLLVSAASQFTIVKKGCMTGFIVFFVTTAVLMGTFLFTTELGEKNKEGTPETTTQAGTKSTTTLAGSLSTK